MSKNLSVKITTAESELEFSVSNNSRGSQLFNQVIATLNLREVWYFGLLYTNSKGIPSWLETDRKIISQDISKTLPLQFQFCVRYYPEEVENELIQEVTQRLFYLQVRRDILDGIIYCPAETCVLLASYACQVKYGDYRPELDSDENEFLFKDKLLPERIIDQFNMDKSTWISTMVKLYKNHKDMLREEAIMEYLKLAQDLDMFGVNYFDIKNKKGTELILGVDTLGLNIYSKDNKLTATIGFPWSEIKNVSYKNKKFVIKSSSKTNVNFIFYTESSHINKLILQMATGNHSLYLKRRKPDTIEIQQMKAQAQGDLNTKLIYKDKIVRERLAKEEIEQRLNEMEGKLKKSYEINEESERKIEEYERKIKELNDALLEAENQKLKLQEMQRRLEENNQALLNAKDKSDEEYQRLLEEKEQITNDINQQSYEVEKTRNEIESYQHQLDEYQREKEVLESKLEELAISKEKEHEAENVLNDFDFDDRELDREIQTKTNLELKNQLTSLEKELNLKRNQQKLEQVDIIHAQNQKQGRDKFQTLREIRQGTVKKRADIFETM